MLPYLVVEYVVFLPQLSASLLAQAHLAILPSKHGTTIATFRAHAMYVFGSRVVKQFGGGVRGAGHVVRGA